MAGASSKGKSGKKTDPSSTTGTGGEIPALESAEVVVRLQNVHKVYMTSRIPVRAVTDITMTIERGEFVALMGPSGCGKSTLLNLLGAVDVPTEGSVWINGQNLAKKTSSDLADLRRDEIGFVFQFYNLIPMLTAFENVELPMSFKGLPSKQRHDRAMELLDMVQLRDRSDHLPSLLSGGEQQRVAIARALANSPSIILLDEPTGDLDQKNGEKIMNLLKDLNRKEGVTLIMVTHDERVASYATRKIRMLDGRIVSGNATGNPVPDALPGVFGNKKAATSGNGARNGNGISKGNGAASSDGRVADGPGEKILDESR